MQIEKTTSILSCGWLGLPLGARLIECCCCVKGATRSPEKLPILKGYGIDPYLINLNPEMGGENVEDFLSSEVLIINIPPEMRDDVVAYHYRQVASILQYVQDSPVEKILFVSSTSVYPSLNRAVCEEDASYSVSPIGDALLKVESLLMSEASVKTTCVRFSGLMGYDRKPGKFFAGKKELPRGGEPVNFIHRDDCVEIICRILKEEKWGEIYNASADVHPTKKEFYSEAAKVIGLEPPAFANENQEPFKIIDAEKLKADLNYTFKYSNPMDALHNTNEVELL
ncbi:NAD-dependent epimerase/dehydratase [Chloroherpeton thalassium ATCC 35110]|uniref:NAD-dependent epimerase/dehydratase n=1 Tax=Chloroherpeton thalassium (strain ATCC 35110 / GB-78) TaxID=517418 RepID=B3QUG7_CHLT3|nr:epimerase [Chloroherpeton thalassium]ACF14416.1 NAD-dependent epimerase/dehydratase [Chloroherpeton thalassium ATCC 35110]